MAKRKQGRPRAARRTVTTKRRAARKGSTAGRATATRSKRRTPAPRTPAASRRGPAGAAARKTASTSKKTAAKAARRTTKPAKQVNAGARAARPPKVLPKRPAVQHRLQIDRARRTLDEPVTGPPSSLDLDRHPSAARSGRAEMREALSQHTESSPRLTGGDVDANWASAFSTGDEAPGGDMPTPDQDIVEEIGSSLGVQYADDEELKAVDKIQERDRHRWELDPASAEDYRERNDRKKR